MNSTTRVPSAELNGVYGGLLRTVMRKKFDRVPEGVGVLWNHPAAFKDMMKFGSRTEKWTHLDANLSSLAAMATAAEIGCSFCLDLHYFMRHNKGLDEAKAREVPRWRESEVFTPLERRVMEYAAAICQTSPAVTDELSAALLGDLGAPALVELTAKIGTMNLTARTNVALGIRSAEFAESCGLPPLASPSREGVSAS